MIIEELELNSDIPAKVPEHSLALINAMSGGKPMRAGDYLFYVDSNWLMAIGYPLRGKYNPDMFLDAFNEVAAFSNAISFFAIAPEMPEEFSRHVVEQDRFYLLGVDTKIPGRLRRQAEKAGESLEVTESESFSPDHRRLWSEFLDFRCGAMNARVMELYRATPHAFDNNAFTRLLDARDHSGNLVASLFLDYSAPRFVSYILGAHSRKFNVPHAMDLLFLRMLENAGKNGKRFINLGLGVNDGILRFKKKWGAKAWLPFQMAEWSTGQQDISRTRRQGAAQELVLALLRGPNVSARQLMQSRPIQKPFAMLWEVEKNGRKSWLGGTAHFFCHSFEASFEKLFKQVENVIFEGPLDPVFMGKVDEAGKKLESGRQSLDEMLTENEKQALEKMVYGPRSHLAKCLGMCKAPTIDIRHLLKTGRYWYVFFTIWTAFLERQGWGESVDMEAWRIARSLNKNIIGMENLEEQLTALGSLPVERVVNFFRNCRNWKKRASNNRHAYLAGDLEGMMGSSAEFPTHTEHVLDKRDQRFRERMRPWLEKGGAAVFVGSAHMVNLRHMLAEDGFRVRQAPFGIWPLLHKAWRDRTRPDERVVW